LKLTKASEFTIERLKQLVNDDAFWNKYLDHVIVDEKDKPDEFLKSFLRATTTFSNKELYQDRSTEQAWRTFDNKFLAIGAVLK